MLVSLVVVIAAVMAMFVNVDLRADNTQEMISMANIEALANENEEPGDGGAKKCYNTITIKESHTVLYCGTCTVMNNSTSRWYSGSSTCTP